MALPRSAIEINQWPSPNRRFDLGTKIHWLIETVREMSGEFGTAGALGVLVNELRTRAIAAFTLTTELRARLHTAGDYQVLLSAIRAELISGGQIAERLLDLENKAYNQVLTASAWAQDAGTATDFSPTNNVNAIVNGAYYAAIVAASANQTPTAGWNTGAGETRLVTIAVSAAGAVSQTPSAVGDTVAPRPPSGECPLCIANVPANFTAGVTEITAGGVTFTDGFPRRLAVHTPIATANVAAIVAAAPVTVSSSALADVTATMPDSLPDHY